MLFDGDLLLDMEMTIYEDLMVKCGGFSVTLSGSHFQFRTPFTSVPGIPGGIPGIGIRNSQLVGNRNLERKLLKYGKSIHSFNFPIY